MDIAGVLSVLVANCPGIGREQRQEMIRSLAGASLPAAALPEAAADPRDEIIAGLRADVEDLGGEIRRLRAELGQARGNPGPAG